MNIEPAKDFNGLALAGASEGIPAFTAYAQLLDWGPGHRDESAWSAFLRAGSLGVAPDKAAEVVTSHIRAGGGTFNVMKLRSQLRRAFAHVGSTESAMGNISSPPKTTFSPARLKATAAKASGIDTNWLRVNSPFSPDKITSEHFLEHTYHAGEKILVFTHFESQGQYLYDVGEVQDTGLPLVGHAGVWFLVNPVDGEFHPNPRQDGKLSRRSEESVTSWRYLVLESDVAETNNWLACLVQLPLKIAAIYTSGGKSIHALVRLDAVSKQHWDQERDAIKPIVVTLGADANAMTAVRLSRLPGAMRGDNLQQLLYLNPEPDGTPIITSR